jgi:predicted nucleic acid-binding protein
MTKYLLDTDSFILLIGATAIMEGRTLVTSNARHFLRLGAHGLLLENWKA